MFERLQESHLGYPEFGFDNGIALVCQQWIVVDHESIVDASDLACAPVIACGKEKSEAAKSDVIVRAGVNNERNGFVLDKFPAQITDESPVLCSSESR